MLTAERAIFDEQQRQKPWEASVALGYSVTDTFESGEAGPNAAFRVRIPLWDRSTRLKVSERKAAWLAKEDASRAALLADIQVLCEQAHQVRALDTLRKFARDRLTYRRQLRVSTGAGKASAILVAITAPLIFLFFFVFRPEYVNSMLNSPLGQTFLVTAIALELIGLIWTIRLLKPAY